MHDVTKSDISNLKVEVAADHSGTGPDYWQNSEGVFVHQPMSTIKT